MRQRNPPDQPVDERGVGLRYALATPVKPVRPRRQTARFVAMLHASAAVRSGRSFLAAGTTAASVVAVMAAAPLTPQPVADPPLLLSAVALPFDVAPLDFVGTAASSIDGGIESLYLALEPWAQYGANLLSWAVGWVPFLGVFAPQINFFYDLGEAVTRSLVFNTAELLDGTISFGQALSNIGSDATAAVNTFFVTQVNWLQSLLPPPPPFADATAVDPAALVDSGALPDLSDTLLGFAP